MIETTYRIHLDDSEVAAILADKYEIDRDNISLMWLVDDDGVFQGVTIIK